MTEPKLTFTLQQGDNVFCSVSTAQGARRVFQIIRGEFLTIQEHIERFTLKLNAPEIDLVIEHSAKLLTAGELDINLTELRAKTLEGLAQLKTPAYTPEALQELLDLGRGGFPPEGLPHTASETLVMVIQEYEELYLLAAKFANAFELVRLAVNEQAETIAYLEKTPPEHVEEQVDEVIRTANMCAVAQAEYTRSVKNLPCWLLNDPVTNSFSRVDEIDFGDVEFDLNVGKEKKNGQIIPVNNKITYMWDKGVEEEFIGRFGEILPLAIPVLDAVYTLWKAGFETFTAARVARIVDHLSSSDKVTQARILEISRHIIFWCSFIVKVDAREELRSRHLTADDAGFPEAFATPVLAADYVLLTMPNGVKVWGWKFRKGNTYHFNYSEYRNNNILPAKEFLNVYALDAGNELTKKKPRNNTYFPLTKRYLTKRINVMYSSVEHAENDTDARDTQRKIIKFDSLYKNCGVDRYNKKATEQIRKHAITCLENWKAKNPDTGERVIADYELRYDGRRVDAIKIKLLKKRPRLAKG